MKLLPTPALRCLNHQVPTPGWQRLACHSGLLLLACHLLSNAAAVPANDNFANAQSLIGGSGTTTTNNTGASLEAGEPQHAGNAGGHSVWYRWQANCSGTMNFDTTGSTIDTLLAVYTGTSVSGLAQVAANVQGPVSFGLVPGQVYQIAVDGMDGQTGDLVLNWQQTLTPGRGPDLIIWKPSINPNIVNHYFSSTDCEVGEGCVVQGNRRLLRFDTETRNIGNEDVVFGNPADSPLFRYAACHNHYHFSGFATYRLLDSNNVAVAVGNKNGFCLEDVMQWDPAANANIVYDCGYQGIQSGWADVYTADLPCQYIDVTDVPPGEYTLELHLDPLNRIVETDDSNNTATVNVVIDPPCSSPPANDAFLSAQVISNRIVTVLGNTTCATKEAGERTLIAGVTGGNSIWFSWTAPYSGTVDITTEGSGFDTLLAAYTGISVSSLTVKGQNDDISANVRQSEISFTCVSNVNYKITVDGYHADAGLVQLNINPAANDNFVDCMTLYGSSGAASGFSRDATHEAGEPNHAGVPGDHSLWFCWTPPTNGLVTMDTVGSRYDTTLSIYTGNSLDSLVHVASDDDSGGNLTSRTSFFANSNNLYRIVVDSGADDFGVFFLHWSMASFGPPSIVTQPESTYALVGSNAMFSVSANGTAPLTYKWTHNNLPVTDGGNVSGATTPTLTITNVQPVNRGVYQVKVSNAAGATNSVMVNLVVTDPSRYIFVGVADGAPGNPVIVPVEVQAKGNENIFSFSLDFDATYFANPEAALGTGVPDGSSLSVDSSQAESGRLGLTLTLPAGQALVAGTRQLVTVQFDVASDIIDDTTSPVCFADQPVARDIFADTGEPLAGLYACGHVDVKPGLEADVYPRPDGGGVVAQTDMAQVGRFAVGLDTVANNLEFMRADCAPASSLGNGSITIIDWVQAGRYAAGLDVPQPVGGPSLFIPPTLVTSGAGGRVLRAVAPTIQRGLNNLVTVELVAKGNENALGFTLNFDATFLSLKAVALGSGAAGATLLINTNGVSNGNLGIGLANPVGAKFSAGTQQVVTVAFTAAATISNATTSISLGDALTFREIASDIAVALPADYENATAGFADLLSGALLPDGRYQIALDGILGRNYDIQATTNLTDWITLSNIFNFSGIIQFIDNDSTNYPSRFYRAVTP